MIMKEISEEEFNELEKIYHSKQNEYFNKFVDLDKEYPDDQDFAKAIKPYRDMYKNYINVYTCPEYCMVSQEYIDSSASPIWLKEKFGWINKQVKVEINDYQLQGILTGIARTLEDYYYLIKSEDGEIHWETAVAKLSLIEKS
jgi:hypothetical protein